MKDFLDRMEQHLETEKADQASVDYIDSRRLQYRAFRFGKALSFLFYRRHGFFQRYKQSINLSKEFDKPSESDRDPRLGNGLYSTYAGSTDDGLSKTWTDMYLEYMDEIEKPVVYGQEPGMK